MNWNSSASKTGSRLPVPEDGIVSSLRTRGLLDKAWQDLIQSIDWKSPGRIARGRSHARSGRVRDLWFTPGLAAAEVVDRDVNHATVRFRVFEAREWKRLEKLLTSDLRITAQLLEGTFPEDMLHQAEEHDLQLLPGPDELSGDCDCGDFMLPCEHMAAVHHLLADALEGDPFLLLTLRGRTREQVLAGLRMAWGDKQPMQTSSRIEEDPPEGDWWTSPEPLRRPAFRIRPAASAGRGLRALGGPPGTSDLHKALAPLYEAGAEAALQIAFTEQEVPSVPRRRRTHYNSSQESRMSADHESDGLTERLVDMLAELESAKSGELAERLDLTPIQVRNELLALEELGIVFRTGKTRGTRWWLG